MIGPDHYAVAQDLLGEASASNYPDDPGVRHQVAVAQVHATLALAAAMAALVPMHDSAGVDNAKIIRDWHKAGAWT